MLKIRIIPCLDVKNGKVVKGTKFINLKYAGDPVKQAQIYDKQGADELCFLDITASSDKRNILYNVVKKTAQKCFMPLTVGGGVRSIEDIRKLLLCGADKVSINTAAIKDPKLIKESSELNNKVATSFLGVILDPTCDLLPKKLSDAKSSFQFHLKNAKIGLAISQYDVARHYYEGIGIKKNHILASKYFKLAYKNKSRKQHGMTKEQFKDLKIIMKERYSF